MWVCTVGHLVVASAKNANSVTAGMAIAGFGGANCQVWTKDSAHCQ